MSRPSRGPFIGSLNRLVWQWVRRQIHGKVVAAGFDDLNPAHVAVFRNQPLDGMRPRELADDMQITKQSVNQLLGHLERQGYLVRHRDTADSRSRRIRLTDEGIELENAVWRAAAEAERDAAELIGEDRIHELRRTLADLVSLLGLSPDGTSTDEGLPTDEGEVAPPVRQQTAGRSGPALSGTTSPSLG